MILTVTTVLGGLGIFLLAVSMMTDGLKLAAGESLRGILTRATRTPLRGIAAGALVTSLVRSSSAVTVATIGFVNAGLLTLSQSLGVVYGANIGTTTTGWLVAFVGLDFPIEALAMPLIGLGMLARLAGPTRRSGAFGEALAGFGLFFIAIDFLRQAFEGIAGQIDPATIEPTGITGLMLYVGFGFLATILTQSSGAAVALTLTAASGGVLTLEAAAATVIGTNVGTTSTAVLAVIGATANARRVAAAHVIFNLLTGLVALLLLPALLWTVDQAHALLAISDAKAFELAGFHTLFNLLGVVMIWPFTERLARTLAGWFISRQEALARPQFIDRTIIGAPALALVALDRELYRATELARDAIAATYGVRAQAPSTALEQRQILERLLGSIAKFIEELGECRLSADQVERLARGLRITNYLEDVVGLLGTISANRARIQEITLAPTAEQIAAFEAATHAHVTSADPALDSFDAAGLANSFDALREQWHDLKAALLEAAIQHRIPLQTLNPALEALRSCLKVGEQMTKVALHLEPPVQAEDPAAASSTTTPTEERRAATEPAPAVAASAQSERTGRNDSNVTSSTDDA